MHCVVCVKQVPDVATVKIDPKRGTLIREGVPSTTNPFDLYALEAALELRDEYGGKVTAVTMGPPQAEAVLRDAIAMGVDDVLLLSDPAFAGADTLATSYVLARAIERLEPEATLVFAGKQAIDGDTGQVGPGISRRLGWTQLTYIYSIDRPHDGVIEVERLLEDGREVLEARLPAVVTVVKDINEPRLPSLRGLRRAKTAVIPVWDAERLGLSEEEVGLAGSPTQVVKVFTPTAQSSGGERTEAPAAEAAALFVKWLEDNRILKER
jgi:electron transfer flavoprotein beta subunit